MPVINAPNGIYFFILWLVKSNPNQSHILEKIIMAKNKLKALFLGCTIAASLATTGHIVKAADYTLVDAVSSATSSDGSSDSTTDSTTTPSADELEDGSYSIDLQILKETEDTVSNAGYSFNTSGARLIVKDGSYTLRLSYTNSMIENLRQVVDGKEVKLTEKLDGDTKYVEVTFSSINEIAYFGMDINTGTSFGVMSHIVRIVLNADTVQKVDAISVTKVSLNKKKANAIVGDTLTLTTSVAPSTADNTSVVWTTSDSSIATVSKKGVVTMKKAGTVKITATAADGSGIKATCTINVEYGIQYVLNGGTNSKKNPSSYYNEMVTLKKPTKKGYTFVGWYTDKGCTKAISTIKATSAKNVTVYAKWKKVTVKASTLNSVKSTKANKMTISFATISGAEGYQIKYSTNKNFKNSKSLSVTSTSKTVGSLKSKKTYYVKVRAYKTDSTGTKIYGSYSKTMKVTVK